MSGFSRCFFVFVKINSQNMKKVYLLLVLVLMSICAWAQHVADVAFFNDGVLRIHLVNTFLA